MLIFSEELFQAPTVPFPEIVSHGGVSLPEVGALIKCRDIGDAQLPEFLGSHSFAEKLPEPSHAVVTETAAVTWPGGVADALVTLNHGGSSIDIRL